MYKIKRWWCETFHDDAMCPLRGMYFCRRCGMAHKVPWEAKSAT